MGSDPYEAASRRAFERVPEAYLALDTDGRCTYVNAAAAALFGGRSEDLLGKQVWTEFADETLQSFRATCEQAMAEQQARAVEGWFAKPGRWFVGWAYPAHDGLTLLFRDIDDRKREELRLQAQRRLMDQAQELAQVGNWIWEIATDRVEWSEELYRIYGVDPAQHTATFEAYLARVHADDRERVSDAIQRALRYCSAFEFEERIQRPDGEERVLYSRGVVEADADGHAVCMLGVCQDITERRRDERMAAGQHEILLGIAAPCPLAENLGNIARLHEALNPGSLCSLLLLDDTGRYLLHGAAPSLPQTYNQAVRGLEIADECGSCGTAAWRGKRVVVEDIATHPYWTRGRSVAMAHGLRACWSTPVFDSRGKVLGTFAVYYREPRVPRPDELDSIDRLLPLTGIAIESARLLERLHKRNRFFEMSQEIFCILDPREERIVQFNPFLQRLTGYGADELKAHSYRQFLLPASGDASAEAIPAAIAPGQTREFVNHCIARDGSEHRLEWTAFAASDGLLYAVARDITGRHQAEEKLIHAASHDPISGLPRRALLEEAIAGMLRNPWSEVWVVLLGLDRFQVVNESVGHVIGDDVLRHVADRLRAALDMQWPLACIAGDKFAVAAEGLDREAALALAERLRAEVARPIEERDYRLLLTASAGISHSPVHGDTPAALLRGAEAAMMQAKREGRDRIGEFSVAQKHELDERVLFGGHLRDALRRDELVLYYQPQYRALDHALTGFEALLRWNCGDQGQVMPGRFIPVAEALGLMPEIGGWVFAQAARQLREWIDRGHRRFTLAVNVSAQQIQHPHLVEQVATALKRHGVPGSMLEIEMTESALMENVARIRLTLAGLKSLGVRLALDDFGTGYSSLAYLKQFPIDKLKIDQSFVRDLPDDAGDGAIVQTIIELGHQLGMLVSAEGVETPGQAIFLAGMGCDELQGRSFGMALPAADVEHYFVNVRNPSSA
ncbi:EAL domain-containing protein [Rhodanobacter sp. DHG33]|uniref:sensor domain-containing protein n=1 Tax=Rhodanobacter sp. DHG33 TaxID=2775921 RepID=UPI00177F6E95|nr:EAL domain-containing protein [Rhodanobacter sp. DHG33]MBD8899603.1 EAL domain-containing protein [Rhodanobacter sp. DHG33]